MRIKSAFDPDQLHHMVREYRTFFNESEQQFLINMLVACDLDQPITDKQWAWLSALTHKISILTKMEND